MKTTIIILLFLLSYNSTAQQADSLHKHSKVKYPVIITGYHLNQNQYAELGFGYNTIARNQRHPFSAAWLISTEIRTDGPFVGGLKAGIWANGGISAISMGFNAIDYTDFHENSLCLRPEVGIGFGNFRLVYGYNVAVINKSMPGINTHNFAVNVLFNLKKKKVTI